MPGLVDATGASLVTDQPRRRIVSLIPSTTEALCALGLAAGSRQYAVTPTRASARPRAQSASVVLGMRETMRRRG